MNVAFRQLPVSDRNRFRFWQKKPCKGSRLWHGLLVAEAILLGPKPSPMTLRIRTGLGSASCHFAFEWPASIGTRGVIRDTRTSPVVDLQQRRRNEKWQVGFEIRGLHCRPDRESLGSAYGGFRYQAVLLRLQRAEHFQEGSADFLFRRTCSMAKCWR